MKIAEIEALSQHVTQQDIDDYELECGNWRVQVWAL
jgi:hypothetical protein